MSSLTINFVSSKDCDNVRVMRKCTSMNEVDFTQVATLSPGAKTYTDDTVMFGQTYEYKIGVVFTTLNKVFYSNIMKYTLGENILAGTSPVYRMTFDKVLTANRESGRCESCDFDIHGNMYVANTNGELTSISRTGIERWSSNIASTTIQFVVTTVTGFIYAVSGVNVIKVRADDGSVVWSKNLGLHAITGLAVNTDDSFFICHQAKVSLYDNNGNEIWSHYGMFSTISGLVCDIRKNTYVLCGSPASIRKLNAGGVQEWSTTITAGINIDAHHEVGDYVFVRNTAGILKIDKEDGAVIETIPISSTVSNGLNDFRVTANGNIVLSSSTAANSVSMLSPTGDLIWSHPTAGSCYSVAVSASRQSNMLGLHRLV